MITVKFSICDEVVYLNTATGKFEKVEIQGIRVVPTGISKDEKGNNKLDGYAVLYQTVDGPILSENEVFASVEEAKKYWTSVICPAEDSR